MAYRALLTLMLTQETSQDDSDYIPPYDNLEVIQWTSIITKSAVTKPRP